MKSYDEYTQNLYKACKEVEELAEKDIYTFAQVKEIAYKYEVEISDIISILNM